MTGTSGLLLPNFSLNNTMFRVEEAFGGHTSTASCSKPVPLDPVAQDLLLSTFEQPKDRESTDSLENLFQYLSTLTIIFFSHCT